MGDATPEIDPLLARLALQGGHPPLLQRLAALRSLCQGWPGCRGLALVGSFAQGRGDRVSDLDLAALVDDDEGALLDGADATLCQGEVLHSYRRHRSGEVAFRKVVYLDFSSCEFHVFNRRSSFRLRQPYLALWDPDGLLAAIEVDGDPPGHETFTPYPHGDDGLIWELVDCIKWLRRGRTGLARDYLVKLGAALPQAGADVAPCSSADQSLPVTLQAITADSVRQVVRLAVADHQQRFVAPNAVSLAQALFAPDAWYRAICRGDEPVGFVMLSDSSLLSPPPERPRACLWRFMVDARHQGQGIGKAALRLVIDHVRDKGFDELELSYVPGAGGPERLYRSLGFRPTGAMDGAEVVMSLSFAPGQAGA